MVPSKKRFAQLIEEVDRTPWGPREQSLVAEAVLLATEIGDEQLEYQARMRQTASANMGGHTDLMLSSFAWCLARHDSDPTRFPLDIENGAADLMWQFKWMASSLRASPAFSTEQIDAVLDDMETHYRASGLGMSGVLMARFEDAHAAGRMDEAERLRLRLDATPRDSHSHCEACERSQTASFLSETGRMDEAIRLIEEMIEGGFSCGEEPEHALSVALVPYLRLGRTEPAKAAHLRSYRLAKDNPDMLATIARNIVFCAITGNEARALSLVERHADWLSHDRLNGQAHFSMLIAIGTTLDRVSAAGHADAVVRGTSMPELVGFFGAPPTEGDPWTAAALAPAAWAAAERIGRVFDERDGFDGHARRLREARSLAWEQFDVPIRTDALPVPTSESIPGDVDGWYQRILDLAAFGAAEETLEAMPRVLDAVTPPQHAVLTGQRLAALMNLGREEEAEALLPDRIRALREAGLDAQAAVEERFGLAMFGNGSTEDVEKLGHAYSESDRLPPAVRGDMALTLASHRLEDAPDAALDLAELAARHFEEAGDRRMLYGAVFAAIHALLRKDDVEAALVQTDLLISDPDALSGVRARAHDLRARIRGGRGELAAATADADEATRILARLGGRRSLAGAYLLAGALWEDFDEPAQALNRYRVAARLIEQEGGDLAGARYRVGRAMLAAGEAPEAAEVFSEVLSLEEGAGVAPGSRAMTVLMLARALHASEEADQAYSAFGLAAELFEEAGAPADRAMAMLEQARLLSQFGEHEEAIETLEGAETIVRTAPDALGAVAEVLHNLGQAYGAQQDERAFVLFDEVERIAIDNDAMWLAADVTDSRARAYAARGQVDEAVAAALTATDGYEATGDAQSAGSAGLLAARALSGSGRAADAVAVYRAVLEHAAGIPPLRQIAALELGDVLEGLGRTQEASEARAIAER